MVSCLFSVSADTMEPTALYQRNLQGPCDKAVTTSSMNWSALFFGALFGAGFVFRGYNSCGRVRTGSRITCLAGGYAIGRVGGCGMVSDIGRSTIHQEPHAFKG